MSESTFWRFSLGFYAAPGVSAACLELQDRHGADVNVLLFLLFLATEKRAITLAEVRAIDAEALAWREGVVAPLRSARRTLRKSVGKMDATAAETLRTEVKRVELLAERIEQEALERMFPAPATGTAARSGGHAARTNIAAYASHLGGLADHLLAPVLQAFDTRLETLR